MRRHATDNGGTGAGECAAQHGGDFGRGQRQGEQRLQKVRAAQNLGNSLILLIPLFRCSNTFLCNILKYQRKVEQRKAKPKVALPEQLDFLHDVQQPQAGFERISQVCAQLPTEWCVLQLCKSFNPATSYSTFCDITASKGDIYLSLLRHCRSPELPAMCLHFNNDTLGSIFMEYSTLVERFRRVVTVDPLAIKTQEAKAQYWKELNAFGDSLKKLIAELTNVFAPYCYLFLGKRYTSLQTEQLTQAIYRRVDEFCLEHNWSSQQRVLLSQAALHANRLPSDVMQQLSHELSNNNNQSDNEEKETETRSVYESSSSNNDEETETQRVRELLKSCASDWEQLEQRHPLAIKRFPTILIVDEAS